MDEIKARHKREQKALMGNITAMKKQATKKTRKLVLEKCESMQRELDERQRSELEGENNETEPEVSTEELLKLAINDKKDEKNDDGKDEKNDYGKDDGIKKGDDNDTISDDMPTTPSNQPKKRNRQKERLAKRAAEIERLKEEAANEAAGQTDYRQIEIDSMNQILELRGLTLHEVKPDGHCLFALILDQLQHVLGVKKLVQELREIAADYITEHRDDFIPFLFDEKTCELRDLDGYVKELRETPMWGSDMEILAFAKAFDVTVEVYMAGAQTLEINPDATAVLRLGFYKKSYGLGEHYNSLRKNE